MNLFIAIQIIFVLLNLIESRHDYYVIILQNYSAIDFVQKRAKWKFWSAAYYLGIIVIACLVGHLLFHGILQKCLVVAALLANRAIFFELPINIELYGLSKVFYVDRSSETGIWFNQKLGKILGKNLGLVKFLASVTIIVLVNVFIL